MAEFGRTTIKQEVVDELNLGNAPPTVGGGQPMSEPPVSLVDLEERILQLCAESPKGITEHVIKNDQPDLDAERRLKALERLLTQVRNFIAWSIHIQRS